MIQDVRGIHSDRQLLALRQLNGLLNVPIQEECAEGGQRAVPERPISPGLGFTSTLTTDVPFANTVAPGVPAGTCLASEFSVQNPANDEATSVVFEHWG